MVTFLVLFQLCIVLALIFIGARVGGIGLGIYGMVGVFILVFIFGMHPGKVPIDVMLIIASVITATAALQAAGGLDYLVGLAAKFLRKHPTHITYYGPLTTWLFCTAHTSYSLLPIISEIAKNSKIRPERPMTVATIAASLGITGSPMSAATAAVISTDLLGGKGIELKDILLVCIPASLIAILVAAFVQNRVGKELEDDPIYQRRVRDGLINPEAEAKAMQQMEQSPNPRAKWSVLAFLLGVVLVVIFGSVPSLRPSFEADGVVTKLSMPETIEILMMSIAALILIVGKASVKKAVSEVPEARFETPEDLLKAVMKRRSSLRSVVTGLLALVIALACVGIYFELFPETSPVEFVKPAPRQPVDDLLDDGITPEELGLGIQGDSLLEDTLPTQRDYDAKAEEIFRRKYEKEADRILSKIYNKDYMNNSEKKFMSESESTIDELMKMQEEMTAESGLSPERARLISSQIIERITEQKKKALGGTNSRGIQKN